MTATHGFHDLREEILEQTWNHREQGGAQVEYLANLTDSDELAQTLDQLSREGLIRRENGHIDLTQQGELIARRVVRAHRLAARLLADLLELPPSIIESQACRLEHAISPQVADSLCTLLGHPRVAPDGRSIPTGACCSDQTREAGPAVHALPAMTVGERGRITFIHPRFSERLDQLTALGLVPGTTVRLKQTRPSLVLEVGETTLALDHDVARDIFVKPAG